MLFAILATTSPPTDSVFADFLNADLLGWLVWGAVGVGVHVAGWFAFWLYVGRHNDLKRKAQNRRTLVVLLAFVVVTFAWLALIPVEDASVRKTIATIFAVGVTGLITLSSTTLAANFMAGIMLRQVNTFRIGDFVRIGDHFGRVSTRGAFHVEIQTELRDLVTLPNAYLISKPLSVVRHSGTMVSCEVSLGYDIPHERIEEALKRAVEATGLTEPYVLVLELMDHAVLYRATGFLDKVESIVSTRSRLRRAILSVMREERIEIVSPTFMNQRRAEEPMIPDCVETTESAHSPKDKHDDDLEKLVFDKAEDAQQVEEVKEKLADAQDDARRLAAELKSCDGSGEDDDKAAEIQEQIKKNERLVKYLQGLETEMKDADKPK